MQGGGGNGSRAGHDPRHLDVHGQELCVPVQEGSQHGSDLNQIRPRSTFDGGGKRLEDSGAGSTSPLDLC